MKLLLLFLMSMIGITRGWADTANHYLTFELTDGAKVSVLLTSDASASFKGTTLFIGKNTFLLVNLKRMYFSTSDDTTTVITMPSTVIDYDIEDIFDLKGQKVNKGQMRRGIYILKSKNGTFKLLVK